MFFPIRLIGAAALLSGFAAASPRPDSAALSPTGTPTPTYDAGSSTSADYGSSGWASQASTAQAWTTAAPTPSYGSGSSSWTNSYNGCVQQCVASFGNPSSTTETPPTSTSVSGSGTSDGSASKVTHTIIVAPTQGVLRYVPFAVNASVGDCLKFYWGADNHTVTKSSELLPCNKTSDRLFTSGTQNKGFEFTQVVNDTETTFFYCGTPGHCPKGMFGIINPPNAYGSSTSASSMMSPLTANDTTLASYASYATSKTAGNSAAAAWGGSIDMSSLPTWSHPYIAGNIMFTRSFLGVNKDVLQSNGLIDLANSTSLTFPQDISDTVNSAGSSASSGNGTSSGDDGSSGYGDSSGNDTSSDVGPSSSAVISTSSSKILLGLVVGFSTYMMF